MEKDHKKENSFWWSGKKKNSDIPVLSHYRECKVYTPTPNWGQSSESVSSGKIEQS